MENLFEYLFKLLLIVLAREESLWCPFLTDWTRTFFCRKMGKTRSMKEKLDWEVFISARGGIFVL